MKSIRDLQQETDSWAATKGWKKTEGLYNENGVPNVEFILSKLALIHSEVSEAVEEVREGRIETWHSTDKKGILKPEGMGAELADVIIRTLNLASMYKIDLQYEVEHKMEYNLTRDFQHSGKLA